VHQRREVHHFDDGRQPDQVGRNRSRSTPTAQKNQRGTYPFARSIDAVVNHTPNFRLKSIELPTKESIQRREVRRQNAKNATKRALRTPFRFFNTNYAHEEVNRRKRRANG
jgi:hypothetical protein